MMELLFGEDDGGMNLGGCRGRAPEEMSTKKPEPMIKLVP
jgi:hypothetical protein